MTELAVRKLVDLNRADIVKRLPTYITPERFFALCYALDKKPAIAAVAQRNPDGLLNAILQAADAGLLIGSAYNHCSIVAFGDELVLMVDYRGIIYQLTRAGALVKIKAECVYDGDDQPPGVFDVELGDSAFDDAFLEHEISYHKAVIDAVTNQFLPAIQNAELKQFVQSIAPAFQAHLALAENLQKKGM